MFSQISNVTVRPHPVNVRIDQTCIATALLQLAKGTETAIGFEESFVDSVCVLSPHNLLLAALVSVFDALKT